MLYPLSYGRNVPEALVYRAFRVRSRADHSTNVVDRFSRRERLRGARCSIKQLSHRELQEGERSLPLRKLFASSIYAFPPSSASRCAMACRSLIALRITVTDCRAADAIRKFELDAASYC